MFFKDIGVLPIATTDSTTMRNILESRAAHTESNDGIAPAIIVLVNPRNLHFMQVIALARSGEC